MPAAGLLDPNALNTNVAPSTRSVNSNELASKQLENITGKDSVMRQRAETSGKNYSTGRGLLDSSIGAEAAFGAFVDRATPLAVADADRYGEVADQNLGYENQFKLSDKTFAQQGLLQKDNQAFTSGENAQDRTWRSGENSLDRTLQTQTLDKQQSFAAGENALDRTLSREEIASRERMEVERSKAELEKLGYALQLDQLQLSASTQAQIQSQLMQHILAIQGDGNLDPSAKEGAISNAINTANNTAKAIADTMKTPATPTTPAASSFDTSRAADVLVDEAAKFGYTSPSMAELNAAMEYAKANNMNEQQMRAYVRDTLKASGLA